MGDRESLPLNSLLAAATATPPSNGVKWRYSYPQKKSSPSRLTGRIFPGRSLLSAIQIMEEGVFMNTVDFIVLAAAQYSILYLIFGGGLGGAVVIYIVAKMLGK